MYPGLNINTAGPPHKGLGETGYFLSLNRGIVTIKLDMESTIFY